MTRIRALSVASFVTLVFALLGIEEAMGVGVEHPSFFVWLSATTIVTAFTAALVYVLRNDGSIASPVPVTSVPTWALQALLDKGVYNALRDSDLPLVEASWRSLGTALDDGTIEAPPVDPRPCAGPMVTPTGMPERHVRCQPCNLPVPLDSAELPVRCPRCGRVLFDKDATSFTLSEHTDLVGFTGTVRVVKLS